LLEISLNIYHVQNCFKDVTKRSKHTIMAHHTYLPNN